MTRDCLQGEDMNLNELFQQQGLGVMPWFTVTEVRPLF